MAEAFVPLFQPLVPVVEALGSGYVWAVGGAVRHVLEGNSLNEIDVDLTTPLTPDEVAARMHVARIEVSAKGKAFGCLTVHLKGQSYEVTSFRQDSYTRGSRFPQVRFGCTLLEDAQRRDFTFNAIYMAPHGTVEDPVGGVADLKTHTVRFIGTPAVKLEEDPLRAVRFARFCALYGPAGLTPEVLVALKNALPAVLTLNPARVAAEKARGRGAPFAAHVRARLQTISGLDVLLDDEGVL